MVVAPDTKLHPIGPFFHNSLIMSAPVSGDIFRIFLSPSFIFRILVSLRVYDDVQKARDVKSST